MNAVPKFEARPLGLRKAADGGGLPMRAITSGLVLAGISVLFLWSVWAFLGAILWSIVAAIMFAPLQAWVLRRIPARPNVAAIVTLMMVAAVAVLPAVGLAMFLLDQATIIYAGVQSGQIDIARIFERMQSVLPDWTTGLLRRSGITDLDTFREQLSVGIAARLQGLAARALTIGQGAVSFLLALAAMLYLTFFLLRDGRALAGQIGSAVPFPAAERAMLADRFVSVVRATVKGGVVVGIAQGALGGLIMMLLGVPNAPLWAVVMALSSLLPAVGTGLVWLPVSLFLFASGEPWRGGVMVLCGLFVIGSIDNILRPILIGRETRMPDFLVLVTTLGGLAAFGFNGLLIGPVAAALFITMWQARSLDLHDRV